MTVGGQRLTSASAAVLMALVAAGCGGSSSKSKTNAPAAGSPKPAESVQTSSQPQGTASKTKVSGEGATEGAWNAAHTPDNDFPSGSAYDSDPSLPQVEGHAAARYTEVHREAGRIVGYAFHFPSTPIASAKRGVLSTQLPADARQVGFTVKPTCAVMLVQSDILRHRLSGVAGASSHAGRVAVQFNSGAEENSYDAGAVTVASLAPAAFKTPAEAEC